MRSPHLQQPLLRLSHRWTTGMPIWPLMVAAVVLFGGGVAAALRLGRE